MMNDSDTPHHVVLNTERLYLRRFTSADAPLLYALDGDPEVMRYISKGQPTPLEKIERTVLPRWLGYYDRYEHLGFWATHQRATEAFLGWFHLRPDRFVPDEMELGYRLHRCYWGRGFATEGARALVEEAFTKWGVERIVARTLVGNTASQRVMQKCGLRFVEHFVYPTDQLRDWTEDERRAVKYGLSRAAFERR